MSPKQPKPMTGAQLDDAIAKLGLNQTSFAALLGCASRTVRKWVSGDAEVPRHIALLIHAMLDFNIKPEELRA